MSRRLRTTRQVPFGRTVILAQAAIAIAILAYLLSHEALRVPGTGDGFTVRAAFTDAAGLKADGHAQVTVAGVVLGRVTEVHQRDGLAIATLHLRDSVKNKIHGDATARIVPRSALQDLTVDLAPGTPRAGPLREGTTIPPARTSAGVGLDRVVGVLDADTRAQVQVLLGELSRGLAGRTGRLGASLQELARLTQPATGVAASLADRRVLLSRLVRDLDAMLGEVGRHDGDLARVVDAGRRTLDVTAARDRELAGTVRELPATLASLGSAFTAVDALAPSLDPALVRLRPFARRLPAALAALRAFTPTGLGLTRDLTTLATRGGRPARDLRGALETLGPAARSLHEPVAQLLPTLRAIDKNKTGIGQLGDNFSGVFSTNDANGPILRGLGFFEPFDPRNFGFPGGTSGRGLELAKRDAATALTRVCLRVNPVACLVRYLVPGLPGALKAQPLTARPRSGR